MVLLYRKQLDTGVIILFMVIDSNGDAFKVYAVQRIDDIDWFLFNAGEPYFNWHWERAGNYRPLN